MTEYPSRDSHFAHKVVRLMIRCCAAQEIGTDGFLLVTVIAHTEDAKRYSGPVTFWNDQLTSVLGFKSWGKLARARNKAVAGRWLHYEPGKKGTVGRYWTTVPPDLLGMSDGPVDCDYPHVFLSNSGGENGAHPGRKRGASGEHSTLSLNLALKDFGPEPPQAACPDPPARKERGAKGGKDAHPAEGTATAAADPLSEFCFPVRGKGAEDWWLPAAKLEEYRESFPGMHVDAELRKARQWTRDNPSKRKTASGMLAFLTRWLSKAANRGDSNGNSRSPREQETSPFDN